MAEPRREHVAIAAPDGIRLAATLYLPGEGEGPWPAVLEALPYRKDDVTTSYRPEYLRLAAAGFVVCRLDVRGTGSSQGIATDEYPAVERSDIAAVIDWLASRPWSSGAVGMYGTSYSGFNSLQLAAERPPGLRAIISIFASDDRYADDVHYFGGALKQLDLLDYPTYMIAMNALPPVPAIYGEGWREEWRQRVAGTEPWVLEWLAHQRFDAYWQGGSLRPGYDAIEVPTMLIAGWADGYTNIALRGLQELRCPRRLILGPWSHASTDSCLPGPNADLVPEHIRWWDRWLRDVPNGVDSEPPIVLFAQRSTRPAPDRREVRGEWRYEPTWPAERLLATSLDLATAAPAGDGPDILEVRPDTGATAWISCAAAMPWGQPDDQRPDELHSLSYTWPALEGELEILGHPRLRVTVAADVPVAQLSAKLCDVFEDGTSALVTRGLLNLTHRDSRETPLPLEPGRAYEIELELEAASWTFEPGHRVRLDLAGSDWPNVLPPPTPVTLTIHRDGELELPVLDGPSPVEQRPVLPPPNPHGASVGRKEAEKSGDSGSVTWAIERRVLERETVAHAGSSGSYQAAGDVPAFDELYGGRAIVPLEDPGRACTQSEARFTVRWPEATCEAHVTMRVDGTPDAYRVRIELAAWEDGGQRWQRSWDETIPRDLQ
ncbi:MAG: CocE/NonD family hydrolase [Gaiellales bacterium]